MADKPTNKPEATAPAPQSKPETAPEVKVSAFDVLIATEVTEAKKTGSTGKTQSSANSRAILAKLRTKGGSIQGMTAEEIRYALQLSKSAQQTRKAIRTAQEAACEAGDLVFCRNTSKSQDAKGNELDLNTEVSRYYIIPGELVETASADALGALRATATDWVYRSDIKTETRSVLAQTARNAWGTE